MNSLQIFNRVSTHLLTQGKKSANDKDECLYRGPNNTSCAIGCLILDKYYSTDLEGFNLANNEIKLVLQKSLGRKITSDEICMLSDLQKIHDRIEPEYWDSRLEQSKEIFQLRELGIE